MPHAANEQIAPANRSKWGIVWRSIVFSPVLWGAAITTGFYASIPYTGTLRAWLTRYFCSHPIEYLEVGMFFVGLCILAVRIGRIVNERSALKLPILDELTSAERRSDDLDVRIHALEDALGKLPPKTHETILVRRYRDACEFLKSRKTTKNLEGQLRYLAESAADTVADSYSLLLTVNWAIPILGFLGTVVGITVAIAYVTPEQLDTSLNQVTGGLAVAFDTTSVAMAFSLVLVFTYDWVKRSDQAILTRVEHLSLTQFLPLFLDPEHDADPVQQAQTIAARQLLDRTESLIQDQTHLWRDSMETLRTRWSETVESQQQELSQQLQLGVNGTLSEHAAQLADLRSGFVEAFEKASTQFQEALEFDAARRDLQDAQSKAAQQELWTRMQSSLESVVQAHDARTEDLLDGMSERLTQWQTALEHGFQSMESQLQQLADYTVQLTQLTQQGEHLARIERQLAENFEAVRAADTFEQTLHNLTAAVHLLTARARAKAA